MDLTRRDRKQERPEGPEEDAWTTPTREDSLGVPRTTREVLER